MIIMKSDDKHEFMRSFYDPNKLEMLVQYLFCHLNRLINKPWNLLSQRKILTLIMSAL